VRGLLRRAAPEPAARPVSQPSPGRFDAAVAAGVERDRGSPAAR
jgi:hypothetical protein